MGITDLVLVQRHLLFLEIFDSPYKYFAADVNNNQDINITDLVLMQRILLFLENDFPDNTSWRFIPEDFVFLNPNNPLLISPPDSILFNDINADQFNGDFVAIKVGDIDGDADPGNTPPPGNTDATASPIFLKFVDQYFQKGNLYTVKIPVPDASYIAGFQTELSFDRDKLTIHSISQSKSSSKYLLQVNDQSTQAGKIAFSCLQNEGGPMDEKDLLLVQLEAKKSGWLSEMLSIDTVRISSEICRYPEDGVLKKQALGIQFIPMTNNSNDPLSVQPIQIIPNPVNNFFKIYWEDNKQLVGAKIELFECSGRKIQEFKPNAANQNRPTNQFSMTGLPAGIYLLKITPKNHNPQIVRLLKQ